ncbi:MAG: molybdopterin-guanine dinucleotide biosynthesis protein B [Candidatus Eutrophobiaceae bacterium]
MSGHAPLLGLAAFSGTGKTTTLVNLIPSLQQRGLRVGVIKHAHHHFDIDHPGKDSHRVRMAGAKQVLIGSDQRWALMVEQAIEENEDRLATFLRHFDHSCLDLILVEGLRPFPIPKIELHRPSLGHPLLFTEDPNVIAIACDAPISVPCTLPILDINKIESITDFIVTTIRKR